jgi:patatin-like phospholipase/acyl hydrolase
MIIGTSTGALIALCLASPIPPYKASEIVDIYLKESKNIFKKSIWRMITTGDGLWAPKYDRTYLDDLLKKTFSTNKNGLSHSLLSHAKCKVLIPTYCLCRGEPIVHSSEDAIKSMVHDFKMWEIAAAATASPVYFKPFWMKHKKGLEWNDKSAWGLEVDGGIWVNNPESLAVCEFAKLSESKKYESISVLSIGTGKPRYSMNRLALDNPGVIGWFDNGFIDMMINADMDETAMLSKAIFNNHHRVQFTLEQDYQLDEGDDDTMKALLKIAEGIIADKGEMDKVREIVNA